MLYFSHFQFNILSLFAEFSKIYLSAYLIISLALFYYRYQSPVSLAIAAAIER